VRVSGAIGGEVNAKENISSVPAAIGNEASLTDDVKEPDCEHGMRQASRKSNFQGDALTQVNPLSEGSEAIQAGPGQP
jgi:hypothetical protein